MLGQWERVIQVHWKTAAATQNSNKCQRNLALWVTSGIFHKTTVFAVNHDGLPILVKVAGRGLTSRSKWAQTKLDFLAIADHMTWDMGFAIAPRWWSSMTHRWLHSMQYWTKEIQRVPSSWKRDLSSCPEEKNLNQPVWSSSA